MRKSILFIFLLIAGLFFLSACNIINPEERIPSYLKINSFKFIDTSSQTEAMPGSFKITDVWVYIDNNPQGIYELPCLIPVLKEGNHSIQLFGGILENGIASTRAEYPFYSAFTQNINFQPDSIYTINPITNYTPNANIVLNENFEGVGFLIDTTPNSNVKITKVEKANDPLVFEGQFAGKIELNAIQDSFEAISNDSYSIPRNRPVYSEINYLTDTELMLGVIVDLNGILYYFNPKINLRTNTSWNKVYVNFTPEVNELLNFLPNGKIKILLRAKHRSELNTSKIYVDNLKLVF